MTITFAVAACVLVAAVANVALAGYGIDFSDGVTLSQMQCVKSQGLFISMRVFHDGGGGACDANGGHTIELAHQAGFQGSGGIMPYIFPNPQSMVSGAKSPQVQVQEALWCTTAAGFPHGSIYWLDIELDPYNPWPNCQTSSDYILEMIAELYQYGPTVGVYTSAYEWRTVTCQTMETEEGRQAIRNFTSRLEDVAARTKATREKNMQKYRLQSSSSSGEQDSLIAKLSKNQPLRAQLGTPVGAENTILLWYAHYDGVPNFSDFSPFGPFKSPFAKQYNDNCGNCGINSDCDWSPI